jgi:hypothetical protein
MDSTILAIHTFIDFETKIYEIEETYSYSTYDEATEDKQHEMENVIQVKILSLFRDYIDWLVEEYGEAKHRACIRMAYNLIFHRDTFVIRRLVGEDILWREFEKIYKEKIQK